jgi:hypothetical protein
LFIHFADIFTIGFWRDIDYLNVHPDLESAHKKNIKFVCKNAKAKNTLKSYEVYFKNFACGVKNMIFIPVPFSDYTVSLNISHMQSDIRSESKLNSILYGISFSHKQSGFKDSCSSKLVSYVAEGMMRNETSV